MKKKDLFFIVNLLMFVVFVVLAVTGLTNWLVLPRGSETDVRFLISMRHFIRSVHEWSALFFMILTCFHIWFHKDYIVKNWNMYLRKSRSSEEK